jgi:ketosteroid isomerase-like protein
MKTSYRVLPLFFLTAFDGTQRTDTSWDKEIRAAEQKHVSAFASNDAAAIEALLSDDFLVNSPRYAVLDKKQLMELVRRGMLNARSFSLEIEQIRRYSDIAVVMGRDSVVFAPPAPNAGQSIRRRFTDIWQLRDGQWHYIARHANPICG